MSGTHSSPARATRQRLLDTFNTLVLNGAKGKITVSDVVQEAGVGRSTFYDHYSSAEDIHQQALAGPMTLLAEALLGLKTEERLSFLLGHFRENRERARRTLSGEEGEKLQRLLVTILISRLSSRADLTAEDRKVASIELAVVSLALIRTWLDETLCCTVTDMTKHIARASTAIRNELL